MTKNQRTVVRLWQYVKRNIWRNAKAIGYVDYRCMQGINTQHDFDEMLTAVG